MVLGYTRTGKTVHRPSHEVPDDHRVAEKHPDWTRGDHIDASRILAEHGEREPDREIGAWCDDWAVVHKRLGR
jgi:hypothetical protein